MTPVLYEIHLDPKTGVLLGYGPEVGGFDAEAKDIGKTAQGWKNLTVDIPRQDLPLKVGDYVYLVVQASPKKTRRFVGWVAEILPASSADPTPIGINLGLRDEQHRAAISTN